MVIGYEKLTSSGNWLLFKNNKKNKSHPKRVTFTTYYLYLLTLINQG